LAEHPTDGGIVTNLIVGIGELLWDVFPDGRKVAGGAPFNFAFHCRQLGHDAVIVSRVGDDELGRELRDEVRRLGLSDEFIQTDHEHPTGTVRVTIDAHGQPAYTITEDVAWDYIGWDAKLAGLAGSLRAFCFGTLAQRSLASRSTIHQLAKAAPTAISVLDLNLRSPHFTKDVIRRSLALATWLKLNQSEYGQIPELIDWDETEPDLATALWVQYSINLVCITRGAAGCELISEGGDVDDSGVSANVVDTVGAGDAFTAALLVMLLERQPPSRAARFANHYAARVCEHQGATPRIDRAEVERAAFGR
jgi:fructokinase